MRNGLQKLIQNVGVRELPVPQNASVTRQRDVLTVLIVKNSIRKSWSKGVLQLF
jgi:hypothetical protein